MGSGMTRAEIRARLAQTAPHAPAGSLIPAAVLVPIVFNMEPEVVFTTRTAHLPKHAGQICFPGGRFHDSDETLIETALREAQEEIGLRRDFVEIGGFLDPYPTSTGFAVLPVIGFLDRRPQLTANADEVAEIFEVPLAFLLDPQNLQTRRVERNGVMRDTYAIPFREYTIWGATAGMIVNLSEKLRDS
jgi:8-oxo-dGTP pyrophosphatase MutT (NUDIX family)